MVNFEKSIQIDIKPITNPINPNKTIKVINSTITTSKPNVQMDKGRVLK